MKYVVQTTPKGDYVEKGKWNKYNIKSLETRNGKDGSQYYAYLLQFYTIAVADRLYKEFKYKSTHGQK